MKKELIIFGGGEIALMAKVYFSNDSDYSIKAFVVDDEFYIADMIIDGTRVYPLSEMLASFPPDKFFAHVALGFRELNKIRQLKYEQIKSMGYVMASYVCSKSAFWPDLTIGDNCFILENQTIQPTVKIGNNVMLWSGNHIGHRTIIRDHAYLSSHVCVAGYCDIGQRSFLGVNSTIKDRTIIGDDCFVGMGGLVAKNLSSGSLVTAERSKVVDSNDKSRDRLLRLFFK